MKLCFFFAFAVAHHCRSVSSCCCCYCSRYCCLYVAGIKMFSNFRQRNYEWLENGTAHSDNFIVEWSSGMYRVVYLIYFGYATHHVTKNHSANNISNIMMMIMPSVTLAGHVGSLLSLVLWTWTVQYCKFANDFSLKKFFHTKRTCRWA